MGMIGKCRGVPKKLDTPAWCAGWLLLKTERKIPLNVLLAGFGVQKGVSQIHPLLWKMAGKFPASVGAGIRYRPSPIG